jgi:CheY-like chemotaxis protein
MLRKTLGRRLEQWGYEVSAAENGEAAWRLFQDKDAPALAIVDWMMPLIDGPTLCRRVRTVTSGRPVYLILLTARDTSADVVAGLEAGADAYIGKPFDHEELRARLLAGERILRLETELATRVSELEQAVALVKHLEGLLPICMYCKKIRDDKNYWHQVERYITEHSAAQFSHGICPECYARVVEPELKQLNQDEKPNGAP